MTLDWNNTKILVTGARGMLGQELVRALRESMGAALNGRLTAWDLDELNIASAEAVTKALAGIAPDIVINSAAYTDVDGCETHRDDAHAANAIGPGNLARSCAEINATLVHFGTDFIFDGRAKQPYQPDDEARPFSAYGQTKWEGECAIRAAGCRHLIVRTSWLFGPAGRNFVEAILDRAESGQPLRVVNDQVGCPTYAVDLADAVVSLLDRGADGVVHYCNDGPCSWFDFAVEIIGQMGLDVGIDAMSTEELDRPAHRPAFSVLDTSRFSKWTGHIPPPWRDALRRYLERRSFTRSAEPSAAPSELKGTT